jgi:L-alanine-DL-glutamate epimerase-like enolase superfamily enzyme
MKIADAETIVVGTPPPHFGGRYFVFVKLTSADGIVGWGEVYAATFAPSVVERMVADVAERHFVGADPRDIEAIWRKVYGRGYTLRPDASLVGVLSGLEIACWDLVGKALDTPVHRLLGGRVRERLRTYTYLLPEPGDARDVYTDPDMAAERAAQNVARGFTAVKFDPAGPYTVFDGHQPSLDDLERSETFCSAIRDAVGNGADLLFGTHGQFTPAGALRLAGRIEEFDPLWFEEPTPPENPEAMAEVAAGTSIPIATGERLVTKYEFHQVLAAGAAHILQPALGRVGGLLEAKKVAAIAEPYYAQIAPHLYAGPIEAAANVQLCASLPNFLILEGIADWGGFHAELMSTPNRWDQGYVEVPDAPGLGVELDEDVARAHPYADTPLHLEMREEPLP